MAIAYGAVDVTADTIALDADGVLLDYNAAYAVAWRRAFGNLPALRDPNAYWPIDRWAVDRLSGDPLMRFRSAFDEEFWSTIPAIEGAVEACMRLADAGYQLVCVTALEEAFAESRRHNLLTLGFPISEVIVTASAGLDVSPKRAAIDRLMPAAFVDDYLPYHRGLPAEVHKALILREPNGSPNSGSELANVDSRHCDLNEFVRWWFSRDSFAAHRLSRRH